MNRAPTWIACGLLLPCAAYGDTLVLKSGKSIEGTFLSGNTREVNFLSSSGQPATYALSDVERVTFTAILPPAPPPPPRGAPPAKTSAAPSVLIPAGTAVTVRLIDAINVDATAAGQSFRASIDDPVLIGGAAVVPRGADAEVQAVKVEQSGRIKGSDEITLKLTRIVVNGKSFDVASSYVEQKSAGEGKKSTRKVLGGAGLGAIVGGIAGGGTGAAIGAAAGGAGGAALSATGQAHLSVPPETRLQFQLTSAIAIPSGL